MTSSFRKTSIEATLTANGWAPSIVYYIGMAVYPAEVEWKRRPQAA